MYIFCSIQDIISSVYNARELLVQMFEKRKLLSFRYSEALGFLKEDENKLKILIEKEIIHQNGSFVELDSRFQEFFELLLEANEEINTATVDENIQYLHEQMDYYLTEDVLSRKNEYLRKVKSTFRKIAKITVRNIMSLQNNIDFTFENELNYKIKIAKLESLDKKRESIQRLIDTMEGLILNGERLFFQQAMDDELINILLELRQELQISAHSLIRSQQHIIDYLNQIKSQVVLVEKIRKVKYLRDQLELRAKSNFLDLLKNDQSVALEGGTQSLFRVSLDFLASDEARPTILKTARERKGRFMRKHPEANALAEEDLTQETSNEAFINLEEVVNGFLASGDELFHFVLRYPFRKPVSLAERVTVFCQVASLYELLLDIRPEYGNYQQYEYAIIYPQ